MTHPAQFSERTFEFAFNAHFAKRFKAVLLAVPNIPSQTAEGSCGFDAAFEVLMGGDYEVYYYQHKVASHVDVRSGSNKHIWAKTTGPYFHFRVDRDQYNLIRRLGTPSRINPFSISIDYTSPRFWSYADLHDRFMKSRVMDHTVAINVQSCGYMSKGKHRMIYTAGGAIQAWRFSEPSPATARPVLGENGRAVGQRMTDCGPNALLDKVMAAVTRALASARRYDEISQSRVARISDALGFIRQNRVADFDAPGPERNERAALLKLNYLLGNVLGLTALVAAAKAEE